PEDLLLRDAHPRVRIGEERGRDVVPAAGAVRGGAADRDPRALAARDLEVRQHLFPMTLVDQWPDLCRRIERVPDPEPPNPRGQPLDALVRDRLLDDQPA